jgi:hypothetical protein
VSRAAALLLLVLLLASAAARAEEWVSLGKSGAGMIRLYVETSGLQINGATRYAWMRDVFKPHTRNRAGTQPDEWVNFAAAHIGTDCEKRTYWEDSMYWYYENGDKADVPAEQIAVQWTSINPAKSVEQIMQFICGWKSP